MSIKSTNPSSIGSFNIGDTVQIGKRPKIHMIKRFLIKNDGSQCALIDFNSDFCWWPVKELRLCNQYQLSLDVG